jgi:hypothetical protein
MGTHGMMPSSPDYQQRGFFCHSTDAHMQLRKTETSEMYPRNVILHRHVDGVLIYHLAGAANLEFRR